MFILAITCWAYGNPDLGVLRGLESRWIASATERALVVTPIPVPSLASLVCLSFVPVLLCPLRHPGGVRPLAVPFVFFFGLFSLVTKG